MLKIKVIPVGVYVFKRILKSAKEKTKPPRPLYVYVKSNAFTSIMRFLKTIQFYLFMLKKKKKCVSLKFKRFTKELTALA